MKRSVQSTTTVASSRAASEASPTAAMRSPVTTTSAATSSRVKVFTILPPRNTMLAGAWFGWPGAVFALLAGAVQGTMVAIAVFVTQGRIEEPEAVKREREELLEAIENAEGEEKEELIRELEADPIGSEPEEGLSQSRIAFGPFLVLATIEYLLFGKWIVQEYLAWIWQV